MYKVSADYKERMDDYIRNRGYITVSIGAINQEAQAKADVVSQCAEYGNDEALLKNTDLSSKYATLEQNFFKMDGSLKFLPNEDYPQYSQNQEYVSNDLLGVLRIEFGDIYQIKGLTIRFSDNCYPTRFRVVTDDFSYEYQNESPSWQTEDLFGDISYIEIEPIEMVGGEQRLRVEHIDMGVGIAFFNDMVSNMTLKSTSSPIAESLSSDNFTLSILDDANRFNIDDENSFINFLEIGQEITTSIGLDLGNNNIYYIPIKKMFLTTWKTQKTKTQFTGRDIFYFMQDVYKGGNRIHSRSLYSDMINVLTDLGLEADQYEIDDCLRDIIVTNPLPEKKHSELIQLICNAGRCVFYQDRDGRIVIKANFATVLEPEDLTVSATRESKLSHVENIKYGSDYVYEDFTEDFFSADGSMYFVPSDEEVSYGVPYLQTAFVSADVANLQGIFENGNPSITLEMPASYVYYGINIEFDGNAPQELVIRTYNNGESVDTVTFSDLSDGENYLAYDFEKFNKLTIEFTKAKPNNRVLVNRVAFGELTDYMLKRDDMLTEPTGTKTATYQSVSVKIFSFTNGSDGKPQQVDNDVNYTLQIGTVGENVKFENCLVSTQAHAELLAKWLGNHYKNNATYQVKYRGDARLDALDLIYMDSNVVQPFQAEIETNQFTFNGAFGGTLNLRKATRQMDEGGE